MSLLNVFLRAEMEAEVRRRMANRAAFTAFDISRAVQASGVRERHSQLKSAVHDLYERGGMPGYTRRLVTLPSGKRPFLYSPRTLQANRFATAQNARRQTSPTIRNVDGWNRLRLPAKALREAGLAPGDSAWVSVDHQAQTVTITRSAKSGDRLYRVDCYGNLRLALGRDLATKFAIATQQGTVTAQAH